MSATLTATGLTKTYRRDVALHDCSFTLARGHVTALVGANGAGKTTLLGILSGLLAPDGGAVEAVLDDGTRAEPGTARVAIVGQEKPLYRTFTVRDMLEFGRRMNTRWDADRAAAWIARADLPLNRRCGRLSGGQRTRIALTLAVASCPDVLLLDEPLADLDPLAREEVAGALMEFVADTGATVVLSTHVVSELRGIADRLLLLSRGRLVLDGQVDDLLDRHRSISGPRADAPPGPGRVLDAQHATGQSRFVVEVDPLDTTTPHPAWQVAPIGLEELVVTRLRAERDLTGSEEVAS